MRGGAEVSPGSVLLDAVEAALRVVPAHVGQVKRECAQLTGTVRARDGDFLFTGDTSRVKKEHSKIICFSC